MNTHIISRMNLIQVVILLLLAIYCIIIPFKIHLFPSTSSNSWKCQKMTWRLNLGSSSQKSSSGTAGSSKTLITRLSEFQLPTTPDWTQVQNNWISLQKNCDVKTVPEGFKVSTANQVSQLKVWKTELWKQKPVMMRGLANCQIVPFAGWQKPIGKKHTSDPSNQHFCKTLRTLGWTSLCQASASLPVSWMVTSCSKLTSPLALSSPSLPQSRCRCDGHPPTFDEGRPLRSRCCLFY